MAMGRCGGEQQLEMFVPTWELRSGSTHVFYERLNDVLRDSGLPRPNPGFQIEIGQYPSSPRDL